MADAARQLREATTFEFKRRAAYKPGTRQQAAAAALQASREPVSSSSATATDLDAEVEADGADSKTLLTWQERLQRLKDMSGQ